MIAVRILALPVRKVNNEMRCARVNTREHPAQAVWPWRFLLLVLVLWFQFPDGSHLLFCRCASAVGDDLGALRLLIGNRE